VVIVGIILLVLANTILMAVRERTREYAVLKTLGFSARHLIVLIFGESLLIAACGGLIGLALTFPMVAGFGQAMQAFFPIINVAPRTIALALSAALVSGIIAAFFPTVRVVRTPIVAGLRTVG
jgi:putative ABC transport system permease protein